MLNLHGMASFIDKGAGAWGFRCGFSCMVGQWLLLVTHEDGQ